MTTPLDVPWDELYGNLRGFVGRRVRNQADVDDLVQRIMLQLLKGLSSLRDSERLYAWVYRTARNVIIDHYRSAGSRREVPGAEEQSDRDEPIALVGSEDEGAALEELAGCMAPMLRQLAPHYQEAVTLADLQGMTQADAAKRLGVSLSGMKSRVQRGRSELKAVLEECCRVHLDRRGGIMDVEPRGGGICGCQPCLPKP